ncbi:MAG: septum formation initiator family protein [Bilifractor sp.]|jgi:cell division protein DivIC
MRNKHAIRGVIVAVLVLMVVLLVQSRNLSKKIDEGNQQISALKSETSDEEERTEEIKELQEYMQTDEYKEQVAKDKLGMIKDGEIIFKESQ